MPRFANYQVWLCGWQGEKLTLLHASGAPYSDFISMKWQKTLNNMSPYEAVIVADTDTKDLFKIDYGILLERDYGAGYYEEFYGIHLRNREWMASGDVDEHYWSSSGFSPEWLLSQPLLQPLVNENPNWARYDLWWAHGPADDVIKQMASESMGGGVAASESERQFSYFNVEGNRSEGAWSCYEGRYVPLLDAMIDTIGEDGSRGLCDFRVVRVTGGFELQTRGPFWGTDRRRGHSTLPTIFSLDYENVLNPSRQVDRSHEVTVAIGGWQGGGMERTIYQQTNATVLAESPFRRREEFYDLRDVSQADVINSILNQVLIDDGVQETVEFTLIQTDSCLYGRDWGLGDLVTLDLWGNSYDMRIVEASGAIDGDNEETIVGVARLWDREDVA